MTRAEIAEELERAAWTYEERDNLGERIRDIYFYCRPPAMLALMDWYEAEHRQRGCGGSAAKYCEWAVSSALNCRSPRILRACAKALRGEP